MFFFVFIITFLEYQVTSTEENKNNTIVKILKNRYLQIDFLILTVN